MQSMSEFLVIMWKGMEALTQWEQSASCIGESRQVVTLHLPFNGPIEKRSRKEEERCIARVSD
jgi:hypothetical protein